MSSFGRKSLLSLNSWSATGGPEGGGGGGKRRSNSNTSCRAAAALAATASSVVDFWGRVSQQMAYIDGSTRSSSLAGSLQAAGAAAGDSPLSGAGPRAPPPSPAPAPAAAGRHRHALASAASCASCTTCSYSSASTASPPPSPAPSPSPRALRRQASVGEADALLSRPAPPKGSIYENYFHYPDDEDDDGVELQLLQPLTGSVAAQPPPPRGRGPAPAAGRLPTSCTFASAVTDGASAGGGRRGRGRLRRFQKEASLCGRDCRCAGPPDQYGVVSARKASSWEESEAVQRRRSLLLASDAGRAAAAAAAAAASCPVVVPSSSELQLLDKRDLRYYFQHPYPRLFITYFVIFCNFLLFAEDPISHSHTESDIPMVGNVFSFVLTKYPPEWRWSLIKVLMWSLAILCGMVLGKIAIHGYLCGRLLRLKMFRDDQGSWMTMFLTVIVSLYLFSHVYNLLLHLWYDNCALLINSHMGVTNASGCEGLMGSLVRKQDQLRGNTHETTAAVMKAAACGTWLGDLITALMVTDMMLQDNLYPQWAPRYRRLWRRFDKLRIVVFWGGSIVATSVVVTLIVSDWISWDHLNRDFLATTELSRAFLASFILVMDLLIVMQDWDFPHFTTTLHVNLPGFSVATLQWKYAEVDVTGKWFNYGIIFLVMLLDLNMWKNQIFYDPRDFGQYTGPDDKVRTLNDQEVLESGNASLWTWESRAQIDASTGQPYYEEDMQMNSRYMNYPLSAKWTAFIPSGIGLAMFVALVSLYGRFPPNQVQHVADRSHTLQPAACQFGPPPPERADPEALLSLAPPR